MLHVRILHHPVGVYFTVMNRAVNPLCIIPHITRLLTRKMNILCQMIHEEESKAAASANQTMSAVSETEAFQLQLLLYLCVCVFWLRLFHVPSFYI